MRKNGGRRPRFRRVTDLPPLRLTSRDQTILRVVCQYRFLTPTHILRLVPGSPQNLVRRLQRLYHAGFLERPKAQLPLRYAGELFEFIYCPTEKTAAAVAPPETFRKGRRPVSALFLAHAIAVSDVLVAFAASCARQKVAYFSESNILGTTAGGKERRLHWRVKVRSESTVEFIGLVPDGVFAVEKWHADVNRRFYYLVEVDRGTMPLRRKALRLSSIHRKALGYVKSRRTRALKEQFDIPGFQVLFVTGSEERLEGIRKICAEAAENSRSPLFLFATLDEVKRSLDPTSILRMVN